jgi:integrase
MGNVIALSDRRPAREKPESQTLTQHRVDMAPSRDERYTMNDAALPGFFLRVSPGGARAYFLYTRIGKGRGARQTLIHVGDAAVVKLKDAREKARAMLVDAKGGVDPVRRAAAEAVVSVVLDEYETSLVARGYVKRKAVMRSLRVSLKSHARRQLAELDRATFAGIMNRLDAKGLAGASEYFRKSVSAFLNWCVNNGRLYASPLAGYRREKATRLQQLASDRFTMKTGAEIKQFWRASSAGNPVQRDYLRFLLLTGQRRTKTATMRWSQVDLGRGVWEIPAAITKTGAAQTVYLDRESLAILKAQPRYGKTDLVFASTRLGPLTGWSKAIRPIRKAFGNDALTLHALRRTYRTMLSEIGVEEDIAERMIAHKRPGIVGLYDKSQLVEKRKDAQRRLEAHIAEVVQ